MNLSIRAAMFAVFLASAAAVNAQLFRAPRAMLLAREEVKKELRLNKDQDKQVSALFGGMISKDGNKTVIRMGGGMAMDGLDEKATKILNGSQKTRLQELWLQSQGGLALTDKDIAKTLGLTSDQRVKIRDIESDMRNELMSKAMAGRDSGGGFRIEPGFREGFAKRMVGVLNGTQKSKFEKMQGKKFEFAKRITA